MIPCVIEGPNGLPLEAQAVPYDGHMRHFQQGPADLQRGAADGRYALSLSYAGAAASAQDFKQRASEILFDPAISHTFDRWQREGMTYSVTAAQDEAAYSFRWFFRGGGEATVIRRALEDPQGWLRAGIRAEQTGDRNAAGVEVEIVSTITGYPQAAGLYRWGQGGKPEVLLMAQYLLDQSFGEHLVNHEFGHALVRCMDMIPGQGFPYYAGIMDYTGSEPVPIDREIEDAKRWLAGQGVLQ